MAKIHMIIQSKSVGKTIIALMLAQYLREKRNQSVIIIDADKVNASLSLFTALHAVKVELSDILEYCGNIPTDIAHVVVDIGSREYLPFCSQLQEILLTSLSEAGHSVHLHTVIAGGSAAVDTFSGFRVLALNFDKLPITVWLNPYFGEVSLQGKSFRETKVYSEHIKSIHSIISLRDNSAPLYRKNFESMLARKLTFEEAISGVGGFHVLERSRLFQIWQHTINQLDCAEICD